MTKVALAAVAYFAIVFAAGFVLGTLRTLWLLPRLGERWAELSEMPLMFMVMVVVSWRLFADSSLSRTQRAIVGGIALLLMLVAEVTLVLSLRQIAVSDYLSQRDPLAGSVYAIMLIIFALLPTIAHYRHSP